MGHDLNKVLARFEINRFRMKVNILDKNNDRLVHGILICFKHLNSACRQSAAKHFT